MNGSELVSYRTNRKLTQAELARRMGVSRERIGTLEHRDKNIKPSTIARYLRACEPERDVQIFIVVEVDGEPWIREDAE